MIRLLQFAAIMLTATVFATGLSLAVVVRTLRRRMRPVPQIPSPAPIRWLVTSSASARLHRRLRMTARVSVVTTQRIRKGFPDAVNLADIGDALGIEASRIDVALVELEPLTGQHRRDAVQTLEGRVRRLEASTDRFCHATEDWADAVGVHARGALDVDDALQSVEEATRTLRQLHLNPGQPPAVTPEVRGGAPRSSARS